MSGPLQACFRARSIVIPAAYVLPPAPLVNSHEKHEGFSGQRLIVVPRPVLATAMNQPLLRNLMPSDAGYYPKASGHQCTRVKGCAETVFIYCARGAGWCQMAGQTHSVRQGQLLVIPAGMPHVYGAAEKEPWTIYWFHAVGINVPLYLAQLQATREKPVVPVAAGMRLFSLFEDVLEDLEHGATLTHLTYAAHSLAHLMGILLRQRNEFWEGERDVRDSALKSVEFMKQHLREPLSVSTLAALANLSRSHYTTVFKRATGYAPLLYLNHLRMQRAVQLLNSTKLSIKAISDELGFSDQFYFSRAFSKLHGHSPSEHRRRYLD